MIPIFKRFAKALPPAALNALLYGTEVRFNPRLLFRTAAVKSAPPQGRRLLVDVTHQVRNTQKSGIPRVVAGIALAFLKLSAEGEISTAVEFVRLINGTLFSAKRYEERLRELPPGTLGRDAEIRISSGDDILMIGANFDRFGQLIPCFERVRAAGGTTASVINDLMPFENPDWFPEDFLAVFTRTIPELIQWSDIVFCVSETTRAETERWIRRNLPARLNGVRLAVFDQGANVGKNDDSDAGELRPELEAFLTGAANRFPIFTQVSLLQPRKGQDFALDVFETRWAQGREERLVYVGRKGWKADALYERIRNHPERGRRFLFVENASEFELARIYDRSVALISPSRGEGYGLPVVEGALRGKPVILSDLPVYREIAGEAGFFFPLDDPAAFNRQIDAVLAIDPEERLRRARSIRIGTWRQGALDILNAFANAETKTRKEKP